MDLIGRSLKVKEKRLINVEKRGQLGKKDIEIRL